MKIKSHAPKFACWLLKRASSTSVKEGYAGDIEEEYREVLRVHGIGIALLWIWYHAVLAIPVALKTRFVWALILSVNYIKVALRNIQKQKTYSLITIFGLGGGMGICLFFICFFLRALKADQFHPHADRIYTVVQVFDRGLEGEKHTTDIAYPVLPALKDEIPEIEDATRFFTRGSLIVRTGNDLFFENNMAFVDPNFFRFFNFRIVSGDRESILDQPGSIVLTESVALKYFGDVPPIGHTLTLQNAVELTVTGVIEDNEKSEYSSTLEFGSIVNMETACSLFGFGDDWTVNNQTGFVRLAEGTDPEQLDEKLAEFTANHFSPSPESPKRLYFFPMIKIAFHAQHIDEYYGSDQFFPYLFFLMIGFLILVVMIVNFVNLSTAKYTERLKEVGLRKVVGANRYQLMRQFLCESTLTTFLAIPLSIVFYEMTSSAISARVGVNLRFSILQHPIVPIILLTMTILTGIIAGGYPAFLLSSFRPAQILKGKSAGAYRRGIIWKFLIVFQFTMSILFVCFALIWNKQTNFVNHIDLGFDRRDVLTVWLHENVGDKVTVLMESMKQYAGVSGVSASRFNPMIRMPDQKVVPQGSGDEASLHVPVYAVDTHFLDVMDIGLVAGRNLSQDYRDEKNLLINRLLMKRLNWENPIGKFLKVGDQEGIIVGVVEDFHLINLYYPSPEAILRLEKNNFGCLLIEAQNPEALSEVLEYLNIQWKRLFPDIPLRALTMEEQFRNRHFTDTTLISEMMGFVGGIAILFSCLGLLGLASYAVRQKTKEIGIRKVLGASIPEIVMLFGNNFMKLVLLSNAIAAPICYFFSTAVLDFAFSRRVSVGIDVFLLTFALSFAAALTAVISQTIKAAISNPAEALRYE